MKTIMSVPLALTASQVISVPRGSDYLSVQTINNEPHLWFLCYPGAQSVAQQVKICGTGHPIEDEVLAYDYVDTFLLKGEEGETAYHVFIDDGPIFLNPDGN